MVEEKDLTKGKIDLIKALFVKIQIEADSMQVDIDNLKNSSDADVSNISSQLSSFKNSINFQRTSLDQTQTALSAIIYEIGSLQTLNASEDQKKALILSQITELNNKLNDSYDTLDSLKLRINNFQVPNAASNQSKKIQDRINKIRGMYDEADNISRSISFDFKSLEKNFLSQPINIDETAIYGDIKYFDYLGAGVLSLIIFFVCLMAPALNIISEKEDNTLYRISTTPASSLTIFLGKFILFMSFGFCEMIYTLFLAVVLYGLRISGSAFNVIIILSLLACCSISIGLFISSKVKTMQQAMIIVPIIVIPSFLISNAFFPPDIMAPFMNYVSYITPMTFSNHALNGIMVKGFGIQDILIDILALIGFTLVPLILFIMSYRKLKY